MAESTSWTPWRLPALDDAESEVTGDAADTSHPANNDVDLGENESIETVDGWDEDGEDDGEQVEEVEDPQIQLPSAEELEAIRKAVEVEAYAEGFAKGEAHGRESGHNQAYQETKNQIEQQLTTLAELTQALVNPIDQQDQEIERILLNSVVTIARAVIGSELAGQPELIASVVQQAVNALPAGEKTTKIMVHPEDLEFIEHHGANHGHWQLTADPQISRGGCRIATDVSQLDATVEQRTQVAIDQFLAKQLASGEANDEPQVELAPALEPASEAPSSAADITVATASQPELTEPETSPSSTAAQTKEPPQGEDEPK